MIMMAKDGRTTCAWSTRNLIKYSAKTQKILRKLVRRCKAAFSSKNASLLPLDDVKPHS